MNVKLLILAPAMALALGACSSDSSSSGPVSVITVSGETIVLDGTISTGCYTTNGGANSSEDTKTFSGNKITIAGTAYDDAECAGAIVAENSYEMSGTMVAGSVGAIDGWANGMDEVVLEGDQPWAEDGALLPYNAEYTPLTITIGGEVASEFFIVDDTGTGLVFYGRADGMISGMYAITVDPAYSADYVPTPR